MKQIPNVDPAASTTVSEQVLFAQLVTAQSDAEAQFAEAAQALKAVSTLEAEIASAEVARADLETQIGGLRETVLGLQNQIASLHETVLILNSCLSLAASTSSRVLCNERSDVDYEAALHELRKEIARRGDRMMELEIEIAGLRRSIGFRLAAPLRVASALLRHLTRA